MVARLVLVGVLLTLCVARASAQGEARGDAPQTQGAAPVSLEQVLDRVREIRDRAMKVTDAETAPALQEAQSLLGAILQRDPAHVEANVLAGEIALQMNDYDRGRTSFSKALETEPGNFRANLGIGRIYAGNHYWRQAIAFLEAAEKVAPEASQAEAKRLLAIAYTGAHDTTRAIAKAQEAVKASPGDLDALDTLVRIRTDLLSIDPRQVEPALQDAENYIRQCTDALKRTPWDRKALGRLAGAAQMLVNAPPNVGILQVYHNSFYETARGQPTDRLKPGKGPDAAAALVRMAEAVRQQALLGLVSTEHDALLFAERAISDPYAATNVKYLEHALATYQQLQELTARVAGPDVYKDTTMRDKAVEVGRRILAVDPQNSTAQEYLKAVGAPLTAQPAVSSASRE